MEVKPDVYSKKQKLAATKPYVVYTEYGRPIIKKANSTIRFTNADMKADVFYISHVG